MLVVTVSKIENSDIEASNERTLKIRSRSNNLCDRSDRSYSVNELKSDKDFDNQHHLVTTHLNPSKLSECKTTYGEFKAEVGTKPKPNVKVSKGEIK